MKKITMILIAVSFSVISKGQDYPHYTMFMVNKLLYNPAYAGHKEVTTVNAYARKQWTGFEGAPAGATITIDGPVGSYMKPFRPLALGLAISTEKAGIVRSTNIMSYYSYRIKLTEETLLSFGLQAGATLYSADYSNLNPSHQNDPNINYGNDVSNMALPNVGAGLYLSGKNYYAGFGIPFLLQNKYGETSWNASDVNGKQIRSYFISGGYVFKVSPIVKLEPQVLLRYAANGNYQLPLNADFNLSCFFYDRLMLGATYRTDQSVEGILFFQITNHICAGYAYDYSFSDMRRYSRGTHEITVGFDFVRNKNKYMNPRFIKLF